jgi:hypothetical protein
VVPKLILPETGAHIRTFNDLATGKISDFNPWASVVTLLTSGILAFALAIYLFIWDSKNTTRRWPLLCYCRMSRDYCFCNDIHRS